MYTQLIGRLFSPSQKVKKKTIPPIPTMFWVRFGDTCPPCKILEGVYLDYTLDLDLD